MQQQMFSFRRCYLIFGVIACVMASVQVCYSQPPSGQEHQEHIAFDAYRNGQWDIYVMNADGSGEVRLTNDKDQDFGPVFSPDGRKIVYSSDRTGGIGSGLYELYEIDLYPSEGIEPVIKRLTYTSRGAYTGEPCFSPDGRRIAYFCNGDIYMMEADGTNPVQLTNAPGKDSSPSWSPDGRHVVFCTDRNDEPGFDPRYSDNIEIYVLDVEHPEAAGGTVKRLTNHPTPDSRPRFSPDGTRIAFVSCRDGILNSEIYVMNADGSNVQRLTSNALGNALDSFPPQWEDPSGTFRNYTEYGPHESSPVWSPDGKRIVFSSQLGCARNGSVQTEFHSQIYVTSADTLSAPTQLTFTEYLHHPSSWIRN